MKVIKISKLLGLAVAIMILGGSGFAAVPRAPGDAQAPRMRVTTGRELAFEPNRGQAPAGADYVARGNGYAVSLYAEGPVLALKGPRGAPDQSVPVRMIGADRSARPDSQVPLASRTNYLTGADPSGWVTNVPQFGRVRYRDVYDGIDVLYYGSDGSLEYDFVVAPGAHAEQIALGYPGTGVALGRSGELELSVGKLKAVQRRPIAYQMAGGRRVKVPAAYDVAGDGTVTIALGSYNRELPLIVDPVLVYSTYVGGDLLDIAFGNDVDASGAQYLTGRTKSPDFPTRNPMDGSLGGSNETGDAFVTKFEPGGSDLVYSTYLGGGEADVGLTIKVNPAGVAYVGGFTCSPNFPTKHAFKKSMGGRCDAFVSKINAAGTAFGYSTYLGGTKIDRVDKLDLREGRVYVAGETNSDKKAARTKIQPEYGGGLRDAFVAKLGKSGDSLKWFTYLGGKKTDRARGVAVDDEGRVFVSGFTESSNFPTRRAFQPNKHGPNSGENFEPFDAFLTKINRKGTKMSFSTFFGGNDGEAAFGVDVSDAGKPYIAGRSKSANLRTKNAFQDAFGGGEEGDGFVAKFSPDGSELIFSTYYGGAGFDRVFGIDIDSSGAASLVGRTDSTDFPVVDPLQPANGGLEDAWAGKLSNDGDTLLFSTYHGGSGPDRAMSVSGDEEGNIWFAGQSGSADFPTQNAFQGSKSGGQDAFAAHIDCEC